MWNKMAIFPKSNWGRHVRINRLPGQIQNEVEVLRVLDSTANQQASNAGVKSIAQAKYVVFGTLARIALREDLLQGGNDRTVAIDQPLKKLLSLIGLVRSRLPG